MPHLPSTRRERKEADLELRVDRLQRDQRFQWLRTRRVRRILVLVEALLLVLIIPGYAAWGSIAGIVITIAAWGGWWLLRMSVRTVADLPDRFLDERQRQLRDRAYLDAYRIFGFIVTGLATIGLVAFAVLSENDELTLTTQWWQAFGLVMFILLLAIVLPSMTLAWRDAGESNA